ncbi:MAG: methyl-accepting chemotaxis protein [Acidihalobacter sp.]
MSLLRKFSFLGAVFCLVLIVLFGVTIRGANQIQNESNQLAKRHIPQLEQAFKLKIAVIQVQQFFTDAGATRDPAALQDDTKAATEYAKSFHTNIKLLMAEDPANASKYRSMQASFDRYFATGLTMAKGYVSDGTAAGNKLMHGFDATASQLSKELDPFLENTLSQVHNKLVDQNRRLENAKLSNSLAYIKMRMELKKVMQSLAGSSDHVATSARQLLAMTQQAEEAISRQGSEVTQVATAMEEMSATAQEVAHHASNSASAAQQADEEVKGGDHVVQSAIKSVHAAAAEIEKAGNVVQQVDRDSDNIGHILDVIRGIADQTRRPFPAQRRVGEYGWRASHHDCAGGHDYFRHDRADRHCGGRTEFGRQRDEYEYHQHQYVGGTKCRRGAAGRGSRAGSDGAGRRPAANGETLSACLV